MDKIEALAKIIDESRNIVFFGGAGVSTESGVPDFRSKDGLYNKPDVRFEGYSPEYLLSHTCLVNEPKVFFEFYRQKMDARNVAPNFAHLFLAKLERLGKLKAVVTQNIDGLHQRAGSVNVLEIHGSTTENYCISCGETYPADFFLIAISISQPVLNAAAWSGATSLYTKNFYPKKPSIGRLTPFLRAIRLSSAARV